MSEYSIPQKAKIKMVSLTAEVMALHIPPPVLDAANKALREGYPNKHAITMASWINSLSQLEDLCTWNLDGDDREKWRTGCGKPITAEGKYCPFCRRPILSRA